MKGIFDPYLLWCFDKKLISELKMRVRTHDYMVVYLLQEKPIQNMQEKEFTV